MSRAGLGLVVAGLAGVAAVPRSLPDLAPAAAVDPVTATATFALRVVVAVLCAYVALVLLAVILAGLRPVPMALRRRLAAWTGRGPAATIRRAVGAGALSLGLLPLAPATAVAAPSVATAPPTMAPIPDTTGASGVGRSEPPTAVALERLPGPPLPAAGATPTIRPAAGLAAEPASDDDDPTSHTSPTATRPAVAPTLGPATRTGPVGVGPSTSARPTHGDDLDHPASPGPSDPVGDPRAPIAGDHQVGTSRPRTLTVRPGDDFWSLAEALVTLRAGRPASDHEVVGPWRRLIEANRDVLPDPADPDLLLPGTVLRLPPR